MKTLYFRQILSYLGYQVIVKYPTQTDSWLEVWYEGKEVAAVGLKTRWFTILTDCSSKVVEIVSEYYNTPVEERGEVEKKYTLMAPHSFKNGYLCRTTRIDLTNHRNTAAFEYVLVPSQHERTYFTQEEINAMPFDTSWFIKKEVL